MPGSKRCDLRHPSVRRAAGRGVTHVGLYVSEQTFIHSANSGVVVALGPPRTLTDLVGAAMGRRGESGSVTQHACTSAPPHVGTILLACRRSRADVYTPSSPAPVVVSRPLHRYSIVVEEGSGKRRARTGIARPGREGALACGGRWTHSGAHLLHVQLSRARAHLFHLRLPTPAQGDRAGEHDPA
jgi:hypothetical protein